MNPLLANYLKGNEIPPNNNWAVNLKKGVDIMKSKYSCIDNLPDILTAQHIASFLQISRRRVYELFQLSSDYGGIVNFDIGLSKRVDKKDFILWIENKKLYKEVKNEMGVDGKERSACTARRVHT